jgi:hypothetical protein
MSHLHAITADTNDEALSQLIRTFPFPAFEVPFHIVSARLSRYVAGSFPTKSIGVRKEIEHVVRGL